VYSWTKVPTNALKNPPTMSPTEEEAEVQDQTGTEIATSRVEQELQDALAEAEDRGQAGTEVATSRAEQERQDASAEEEKAAVRELGAHTTRPFTFEGKRFLDAFVAPTPLILLRLLPRSSCRVSIYAPKKEKKDVAVDSLTIRQPIWCCSGAPKFTCVLFQNKRCY
jgi:hypothetical protein